ncbi:MAG: hypothetical protein L6V92_08110 [Phocaeicola vulgatus]|nr:MAG: hypothetical protein L6V92_08110 [Phocaeicola vulgatus]
MKRIVQLGDIIIISKKSRREGLKISTPESVTNIALNMETTTYSISVCV